MDDLNTRVVRVMEKLGLTKTAFAADLDISLASLTHISQGRNKPSVEMLQKILLKYPAINAEWLLLGTGKMEKSGNYDLKTLKLALQLAETRLKDGIAIIDSVGKDLKQQAEDIG